MSVASAPATERFYRLIRACIAYEEQLVEPFEVALKATAGMARRGKRGFGAAGKVIVFEIINRNGQVKTKPISAKSRTEIMKKVRAHTRAGSLYATNDCEAYASLRMRGAHVVICKERGKLLGSDRLNVIESFWSYAKKWLHPYRSISYKYFHLYLGEVCYRFNHRGKNLKPLLTKLLKTISNSETIHSMVQIH